MGTDLIRGHLDLLLLAVVSSGASYGYAIAEEIKVRSGGEFELPEGSIYPALYRLEAARLLESRWDEASGRRRRVYSLTARGDQALSGKAAEWLRFARAVSKVVGGFRWNETVPSKRSSPA